MIGRFRELWRSYRPRAEGAEAIAWPVDAAARDGREAGCRDRTTPPLILIRDGFPGRLPAPSDCPYAYRLTRDHRRVAEADAVVYPIPGFRGPLLIPTRPGQLAVACSMESDALYPPLLDPAFMAQFDVTMTYRRDATIWCAYFGPELVAPMRRPPRPKTEAAPAVCFVSNTSRTSYDRDGYMAELMQHLAVDSYGRAMTNRKLVLDRGRATKLAICARYKFTLAFENSISQDYVSEKFFDPLVAGSVPVYIGAPNIDQFAPAERCFIDATAFGGPRELAAYLSELDRDERAYTSYLAWRQRPLRERFLADAEIHRHHGLCRLAGVLHRWRAGGRLAAR